MKSSLKAVFSVILALTLAASLLLLSSCGDKSEYAQLKVGDKAPDFTAELVGGESFTLSKQSGKVAVINIWATWCKPCVGEMPAFQMLLDEYGDDIAICAVNSCEDKEVVDSFVTENKYTFPVAYDPEGEICKKFPCDGIPYTVIVGANGKISSIFLGAGSAEEQYKEYKAAIEAAKSASNEGIGDDANVVYNELEVGDKAPDFTAELVGGESFTLSDKSGKVTVINIWATWCMPCVGEMPAFQMLLDEYGDDIAICAVNSCEDKEVVDSFVTENNYTFPIAYDPDGEICRKFPTDGIPYTVIVDAEGNVSSIYIGAAGAEEQYKEYKAAIEAAKSASNEG